LRRDFVTERKPIIIIASHKFILENQNIYENYDCNCFTSSVTAKKEGAALVVIFEISGDVREKKACTELGEPGLIVTLFSMRQLWVSTTHVCFARPACMAFSTVALSILKVDLKVSCITFLCMSTPLPAKSE
jgi:hypothetical protein